LFLTGDHLKKSGFAMSVLSNQSDALFGCERKTDLIQKKPVTEAFRQIFYSDHKKYAQSAKNCDGKYCLNFSIKIPSMSGLVILKNPMTGGRRQKHPICDFGLRPALARRLLLKSTNMDGLGSCDFYWQMV
jgi:hypothetical protein